MVAYSWADQDTADDPRPMTPPITPGARRLADIVAYRADSNHLPVDTMRDIRRYWDGQDRANNLPPRENLSIWDYVIGSAVLARTDAAMAHREAAPPPAPIVFTAHDRPSGALAIIAGMAYAALALGVLFLTGLLLGAIRWGW